MAQATVLFDAAGPRTRVRYRIYSLVFAVLVVLALWFVVRKLDQGGQFESRIFERLFAANVWNAISDGLVATLEAAAISVVTSVAFGFLLAVARLSDHAWVRWPATIVIEFFRAVPVLLLMYFLFDTLQRNAVEREASALIAVVGGLTLYNGSVLAEVFRAGVLAVPKGQSEAAYAIGMRKTQVMTLILTPQAVKFMLPAIISQCVVVLKDTSLGFLVTYTELTRAAKSIATFVGSSLMTYLLIALIYIAINSVLSLFATWLQRRLASRGVSAVKAEAAVEEVLPAG